MSKNKEQANSGDAGSTAVAEAETKPAAKASVRKWRVGLAAGTPLAHPQMELEAACEAEAKQKFCEANGISSSECPWTIEPIA